jgi:Icc-related predicted phosphoesterase
MVACFFVSDLHGKTRRYERLFEAVALHGPAAVFIGGDFLPPGGGIRGGDGPDGDFVRDFLVERLLALRQALGASYPRVFLIMGNDDPRSREAEVIEAEASGVWEYAHLRTLALGRFEVRGYAYVPPTPFLLKDWERYDVSRYVDPGAVSPEEGYRSFPVAPGRERFETIKEDLERLAGAGDLGRAVFLFHAPPHDTALDLADLRGKTVEHVPLEPHVGSIAVRRFIEARRPLLTLHGHVHESARLSGRWQERLGRTLLLSAAHDGPELALVRFDLDDLSSATRELL